MERTLLATLIAAMHVPIWDDEGEGERRTIRVGCSCGWRVDQHGRINHGYVGPGSKESATEDWLHHQEESTRLTRLAVDLALVAP